MLVFRCDCEQVLGVEDEANKGGMGECPTCGRIIRVPMSLVNAAGKLRLAGTPTRAVSSASGGFRQIRETPSRGTATSGASARPNVASSSVKVSPMSNVASATATTAANAASDAASRSVEKAVESAKAESANVSEAPTALGAALLGDATAETAPSIPAVATTPAEKPNVAAPAKNKIGSVKKQPIKSGKAAPVKNDANDPNAAIETKNDRNIAAVANAAASKRAKSAASAPAAAPAKKNLIVIYMIGVVVILVVVAVLYATGVIGGSGSDKAPTTTGTTAPTKSATTQSTTPETKPAVTPEVKAEAPKPAESTETKAPADAEKKDAAAPKPDEKKDENKDEKKEEKKDAAADTKADEKKTNN